MKSTWECIQECMHKQHKHHSIQWIYFSPMWLSKLLQKVVLPIFCKLQKVSTGSLKIQGLVVMTTNVLFTVNPMFYFLIRGVMGLLFPKCASAILVYKASYIIMWNAGNSMVTAWLLCTDKSASICSWSQLNKTFTSVI